MKGKIFAAAAALAFMSAPVCASAAGVSSFPIGEQWPDTDGNHINCHGGCIVEHQGKYYWFGESRTGGHSDGISVYSSQDLYNWENLGYAVVHQGERDDENLQDISEGRLLERPKVIYNAKTGKWVMWAHWENGKDYGQARVAVLKADNITGPYEFVQTMRPNGHDSRDQTLFLDTDGNAYHFCSTNMNTDINVVRLTDDFLNCSENETLIMKGRKLEATTVCKVDDTYFATFSECKGWDPAPGHTATTSGDMLGEWTEGLSFCVDPDASRSYGSQGAFVFSVGGLGYDPKCFIFYGDRWIPTNVGGSTYVWLPMSVRSGYPTIKNLTAGWNLDEVMSEMYRFKRAKTITGNGEYALLERNSNRMMSRLGRQAGFSINDDDETKNIIFIFEATSDPNVWRLKDKSSGRYLVANRGTLREDNDGSQPKALWRFFRLADGYYNVVNEDCHRCLTVDGASRGDGAEIRLGAPGENSAQAFGVYFDSKAHNYEEAPMFTKAYFEEIAKEVASQPAIPQGTTLPFEAGKPYVVTHVSSGRALTFGTADETPRIVLSDFNREPSQKITFVNAPDGAKAEGYNITDGNGNYLVKEGSWNSSWSADADLSLPTAIFQIEEGEGYYLIKCSNTGKYLGTDATENGSQVYTDKTGSGRPLSYWSLGDFNNQPKADPQDLFYEQLDKADIILATIPEEFCGRGAFDYSIDAYSALKAAFERGLTITDDYASEAEIMKQALTDFENNKIISPDPSQAYVLLHNSGNHCVFTEEGVPMLGEGSETNHDKFYFLPNTDNTWCIKNIQSGKYIAGGSPNKWSMYWSELTDANSSKWTVETSVFGKKIIKSRQTGGYI
ncbi:MAG: RICIN domain-containing protein [Muribaculaceae bacterium]|nr:RICIN domain-containing protein [Muribaculaceae bacterium]